MVLLGDIVYPQGRVSQYMDHFWRTYYNVRAPGPKAGAPLMASVPFYPALGNHDVAARLAEYPDALGAYYFFSRAEERPRRTGRGSRRSAATDDRRPRRSAPPRAAATLRSALYSFDDGPAHFLVLDSNDYVPVDHPQLPEWVERDLTGPTARWKFVCFHSPAFHTLAASTTPSRSAAAGSRCSRSAAWT